MYAATWMTFLAIQLRHVQLNLLHIYVWKAAALVMCWINARIVRFSEIITYSLEDIL